GSAGACDNAGQDDGEAPARRDRARRSRAAADAARLKKSLEEIVSYFRIAFAALALTLAAVPAQAEDYPSRPVRIVVPFAAGAGNDLLGRLLAAELTKRLNGQVFVENKPGAASQLGTDLVAKSPADGYTLLWTASDGLSALPAVKASVPYKI